MNTKTVLVTGGTGFLGKRLARALSKEHHVVLGARNGKFALQARAFTGCQVIPLDVSHIDSVRDAVVRYAPTIVIHAAATKFVDLAERQPLECIDVNILGSENVARVALERGVSTVIGISTDKASPPIRNTYGLSKALMERLFCSLDGVADTRFLCVRYGNVAWSTGSVLPIWKEMQERTGVIGTTGPDMRRFFFKVEEAVSLVMTALGEVDALHGTVVARTMKAALIRDILDIWVARRGGRWEQIDGRPGERMDEYLIGELELPYTRVVEYDSADHFAITFNQKAGNPVSQVLSSANADRLTPEEIADLVSNPPEEEA